MNTMIDPRTEAERVRGLLVRELQTRFTYTAQDDREQTVAFRGASLVEDTYLLLEVDCARIPKRWTVSDLDNDELLHHLGSVVGHPVARLNTRGLTYAVRLTPRPKRKQIPKRWELR